jgi:hypothetical protein
MKHCSGILSIYKNFSAMIHTYFDTSIHVFRANSAREYLSNALRQVLAEQGTLAQFFVLVLILRMGLLSARIIIYEITRALMITSSVPPHFWAEVVSTATYLINIQSFRVVFLLSVFMARHPITPAFVFLAMCAMCILHLVSALS